MRLPSYLLVLAACLLLGCSSSRTIDDPTDASVDVLSDAMDATPDTSGDVIVPPPTCLPREPRAHRAEAQDCSTERAPGRGPIEDFEMGDCEDDDDCTEGRDGRCTGDRGFFFCTYNQCALDEECGDLSVCLCGGGFRSDHNVCGSGNCSTDADCPESGFCSPSFGSCGNYSGVEAFYCHTCEDECVNDADCADFGDGSFGFDPYCAFDPSRNLWACSDSQCAG